MRRIFLLSLIISLITFVGHGTSDVIEIDITDLVSIESPSGGYRILLTFDIPTGIIEPDIDYAKLIIPYSSLNEEIDLELYSVSASWERETVSWDYPWFNPGGDYEEQPQSKLHIYPGYPEGRAYFFDITENLRNILNSVDNYGFLIRPSKEYGSSFSHDVLTIVNDASSLAIKLHLSRSR